VSFEGTVYQPLLGGDQTRDSVSFWEQKMTENKEIAERVKGVGGQKKVGLKWKWRWDKVIDQRNL
jgi:hypothetical protein